MNKKIFFALFIAVLILTAYSCSEDDSSDNSSSSSSADNQNYFCLSICGSYQKNSLRIRVDSAGNIYIAGYFKGNVDFDPSTDIDIHTSNGEQDIFVTKIYANGTYGWTKTFGSIFNDVAYGLALDSNGNIYISGYFQGTVDFDAGAGIDSHTSNGKIDIFLTKINANGTYGWTKTIGGTETDASHSITIDNNNNIYTTGYFGGTVDFDPGLGTDIHTSNSNTDIFITKINANGTYGWTKTCGGQENDQGNSIASDSSGNIYISGYFQSTVDFDAGAGSDNHTSNGGIDIFLTKINANGTYGWTKTFGGAGYDSISKIKIDKNNNIYLCGAFTETVDFDPGAGTDIHTGDTYGNIFITKLNVDATYGYTKTFGSLHMDGAYNLTLDNNNNVYITGYFNWTADFNPNAGTDNHTSNGNADVFITKINANGSYGWTKTFGGLQDDYGTGLAMNGKGDLYIVGQFNGSVSFDFGHGSTNHTSIDAADMFIMKMSNN